MRRNWHNHIHDDEDLEIIMDSLRGMNVPRRKTKDEVMTLCRTSHPNLLAYLGLMDTYDTLYLYCTRGPIREFENK